MKTCRYCRFYEPFSVFNAEDIASGTCHRYPPRAPMTESQEAERRKAGCDILDGWHVAVKWTDWCGEFVRRNSDLYVVND